jgi:hypothetical protein
MLILCILVAIPLLLAGHVATVEVTDIGRHSAPLVHMDAQGQSMDVAVPVRPPFGSFRFAIPL